MDINEWTELLNLVSANMPENYGKNPIAGAAHEIIYFNCTPDEVSEDSVLGERFKNKFNMFVENDCWAIFV